MPASSTLTDSVSSSVGKGNERLLVPTAPRAARASRASAFEQPRPSAASATVGSPPACDSRHAAKKPSAAASTSSRDAPLLGLPALGASARLSRPRASHRRLISVTVLVLTPCLFAVSRTDSPSARSRSTDALLATSFPAGVSPTDTALRARESLSSSARGFDFAGIAHHPSNGPFPALHYTSMAQRCFT